MCGDIKCGAFGGQLVTRAGERRGGKLRVFLKSSARTRRCRESLDGFQPRLNCPLLLLRSVSSLTRFIKAPRWKFWGPPRRLEYSP